MRRMQRSALDDDDNTGVVGGDTSGSDDDGHVLEATLEHPKVLLNLIRSIRLRRKRATLHISAEGLKFISDEDKWIQAVALLERQLFKQFDFNGAAGRDGSGGSDDLDENPRGGSSSSFCRFEVSLDHLEQCLNLFGSASASASLCTVKLVYPGRDNSFVLFVSDDSSAFSECELATFVCDESAVEEQSLQDRADNAVVARVLFNSDLLKEIWAEMDQTASLLKLSITADRLALATPTMKVEVGKQSDAIVQFERSGERSQEDVNYNMKILRATQKALNLSHKTLVRLADDGTLALQFRLKADDTSDCYVEFFCRALETLDDESALL